MVALAVHNALSAPRHVLMVVVFNPQFIISSQSYQNIAMCSALCALCAVDAQSTVGDGQRGQLGPIALRTKTTLWTCTWCQENIVCAASTKPWTSLGSIAELIVVQHAIGAVSGRSTIPWSKPVHRSTLSTPAAVAECAKASSS